MSFEAPVSLRTVLQDVATSGITLIVDEGSEPDGYDAWQSTIWGGSGGGTGISVPLGVSLQEQLVAVADQIQEIVIEELWYSGHSASWPECPIHGGHPLKPVIAGPDAMWECPSDHTKLFMIGELPQEPPAAP